MNSKIKLLIILIIYLILFLISTKYYNSFNNNNNNNQNYKFINLNNNKIIENINKFIDIGNSKYIYEESRSLVREFIRDYLINNGISKESIIWNHFEWNERFSEGKNITTTTWTGINIIVWSNTSEIKTSDPGKEIRIIATNYDTKNWGLNTTSGAHDSLAATALLMELIIEFNKLPNEISKDLPFMFIFFDQEKPGSLGSRSFVNNYRLSKYSKQYLYMINIDSVGYHGVRPIIQTFPYEHQKKTLFTPRWLVNQMINSAYSINSIDGIHLGSSNLGLSLMYQAHRYHLSSISYLGDEGPFLWAGIDSLLITDLDFFYDNQNDKIPVHNQLSDQPENLDLNSLNELFNILYQFLIISSNNTIQKYDLIQQFSGGYFTNNNPILNLFIKLLNIILNSMFSGYHNQYLFIGPLQLGYFQLLLIIILLLNLIYLTTFREYRDLVFQYEKYRYQKRKRIYRLKKQNVQFESNSEKEDSDINNSITNSNKKKNNKIGLDNSNNSKSKSFFNSGHRILFIHLLSLFIISLGDTVYSFEIICLGFLSLLTFTYYKYNINLFTGFISSAFCTNFIYKDISQIYSLGRKGSNGSQELYLNLALGIYIAHSILILIYGYDYGKKKQELLKYDFSRDSSSSSSFSSNN